MVKRIEVDAFLSFLGEGISEPALILGSDQEKYIMKNQRILHNGERKDFNCMFLNEMLAYQIARHLDVPVPEVAIANIDSMLIENDPKITFVHRFHEGNHFASKKLSHKEDNLEKNYKEALRMGKPYIVRSWRAFFEKVTNIGDISRILAFDLLIGNFDRYNNTGNLLISNDRGSRRLYAIDHGHAFFLPTWNTQKINMLKAPTPSLEYLNWFVDMILKNNLKIGAANGMGEVFRSIEDNIDLTDVSDHSFQGIVDQIESIRIDNVDEWMNEIPDEWYISKTDQITYYKQFLMNQKNLVRDLIQRLALRQAFSNYRGGVLEWESERPTGTV